MDIQNFFYLTGSIFFLGGTIFYLGGIVILIILVVLIKRLYSASQKAILRSQIMAETFKSFLFRIFR